jgi:drug/metabolite transporter (DMT)-like permease
MAGVLLAVCSAVLFGGMSVALGFAIRHNPDAEMGALVTGLVGLAVCAAIALATNDWGGAVWPFLLAGLLAPGVSQILFVRAVQEAGPSRASVVVGVAPLVAVTIALLALSEPLAAPLMLGAALIVAGGVALAGERDRPQAFRPVGLLLAFGCTLFFATRDNVVRWLAEDTTVEPQVAASATILSGSALMALYLVVVRRRRFAGALRAAFRPYAAGGLLWGLSYAALFEAFYRSRVTVVSPLVATEALFGVLLAALLVGRSELIGRHVVLGAALIVAGGALIGAFR